MIDVHHSFCMELDDMMCNHLPDEHHFLGRPAASTAMAAYANHGGHISCIPSTCKPPLLATNKERAPAIEASTDHDGHASSTPDKPPPNDRNKEKAHPVYFDWSTKQLQGDCEIKRGGPKAMFPTILYQILQDAESKGFTDICAWQPHGRAFVIHDRKAFQKEIMPHYYPTDSVKYTSFRRQLNLYRFHRFVGAYSPDKDAYYNEMFLRGRPDLFNRVTRTRIRGTGKRVSLSVESEPNFADFPPMPPLPPTKEICSRRLAEHRENAGKKSSCKTVVQALPGNLVKEAAVLDCPGHVRRAHWGETRFTAGTQSKCQPTDVTPVEKAAVRRCPDQARYAGVEKRLFTMDTENEREPTAITLVGKAAVRGSLGHVRRTDRKGRFNRDIPSKCKPTDMAAPARSSSGHEWPEYRRKSRHRRGEHDVVASAVFQSPTYEGKEISPRGREASALDPLPIDGIEIDESSLAAFLSDIFP